MKRGPLPIYLSAPHPCSYLEGETASSLFMDPQKPIDMPLYGQLLRLGFRRSGDLVYQPHCSQCRQCLSVRIPVRDFQPRRRHRRVLQANSGVAAQWREPGFDDEHYALYLAYTGARHSGGSMSESSAEQYLDFLVASWSDTGFLELRERGRLLGVAVTDRIDEGLSAVYTFFDPSLPQRSLGTFAVLTQLQEAQRFGLPFLYLGYWIRDCEKMRYKADFRPLQVFSEGRWRQFGVKQPIEVTELKPFHPDPRALL